MQTLTPHLTAAQLALLPTAEDIAFYEEHGWYISKKVIPEQVIDAAIEGSKSYYRGDRDFRLAVDRGFGDWKPGDGDDIVRNNEFVSLQNQQLRQLALQPIIGAIAARLARTTQIRLLDDQLVYKPPVKNRQSAVGWHADGAYWATCSSPNLLTAWIPFHDCDEARGPLVVIDGSHKWSGLQDIRYFNQQNLSETEQKFHHPERKITKVPMTLQKGQVSFHHRWTIHGSYSNYSTAPRLALAVHLQDAANHYRPFYNQQGKEIHIFDEVLCRKLPNGDPDFSDPDVFPVVWSEAS